VIFISGQSCPSHPLIVLSVSIHETVQSDSAEIRNVFNMHEYLEWKFKLVVYFIRFDYLCNLSSRKLLSLFDYYLYKRN
jgi:hypothetical protein